MLVYVPILTLQGLEGRLFRPMALTVGMALFGSLLLAMLFVPAAATLLFRRGARESRYAVRLARWQDARYAPALKRTMAHPGRTIGVAIASLLLVRLLVPRLGTEFLPELDEGSILIQPTRDPNISLTHSMQVAERIEEVVMRTPEVATVVSRVGRPDIGSDPMSLNQSDVFVMLESPATWRDGLTKPDIEIELQDRLEAEVPGVAFAFTQPMKMRLDELISGVRSDLAVKVFGDDPDQNLRVAEQVVDAIGNVEGTAEVQVEQTSGQGYLTVRMNRAALARYGIPVAEVQERSRSRLAARPSRRRGRRLPRFRSRCSTPSAFDPRPRPSGA
jgi:cobalt-zinc-cadmium resistance protein CzcA